MNLPNLLTLLRIFFVPLLVAALLSDDLSPRVHALLPHAAELFALAVFLAAAVTDLLDGYLARRWSQVTTVGTLLIMAALVSLVWVHRVQAWMAILIVGREFAVSGLRQIAAASGYTIRASELGKTKMTAQVVAISLAIGGIRWPELRTAALFAMWAVVLFGIVSALDYFRKFWRKVDDQVKRRRRRELLRLERLEQRAARRVKRPSGALSEPSE
jgi:CDP-diacylglycerol---glycerol-3-phosphate 3-phosphatidyltransferase